MLRKITIFILTISILSLLGACAGSARKTETAQAQTENATNPNGLPSFLKTDIPENSFQIPKDAAASLANTDEKTLLVGTWRHNWGASAPNCGSEHIFMSDGTYYGMGGCAGFVPLRTVGKWSVPSSGVIRINVSDWDPKYDQAGNPIHHPPGETFQFRFLDRNRMALGDGAIVAYRVN